MSNDENLLFSQPHLTKVNIMQVLTLDEIQQVSGAACNWRDFSKNTIGSALGGAAGVGQLLVHLQVVLVLFQVRNSELLVVQSLVLYNMEALVGGNIP
ncbi:TPA: hypothetical protein WK983_001817 [Neisseria gonorrhoeae]